MHIGLTGGKAPREGGSEVALWKWMSLPNGTAFIHNFCWKT
jgi:hypothetical protein